MSLSLDGRYASPDGPEDMSWVMPYAVTDVARDHLTSLWEPATTALLGRVNAEGFLGFWPTVIGMEGADPRDEGFARWLVDADKVVLSSTLGEAPWERTTIVDKPTAEVVADLQTTEGGDILVLSSASVIKALLAADLVDRLALVDLPDLPRRRATPLRRRPARRAVGARQPGRGRARHAGPRLRPGPLSSKRPGPDLGSGRGHDRCRRATGHRQLGGQLLAGRGVLVGQAADAVGGGLDGGDGADALTGAPDVAARPWSRPGSAAAKFIERRSPSGRASGSRPAAMIDGRR